MTKILEELRRRHVFRVGVAYLIVAWLVTQVIAAISPIFALPDWFPRAVLILLAIGFPFALIVTWAFELTPEGIKRTPTGDDGAPVPQAASTGRKLDFIIIAALVLALGYFGWDRYYGATSQRIEAQDGAETTAATTPSLAVLPFANLSDDQKQDYFADGLTEELLNQLARLNDLRVIGRTSSFAFKGKNEDLRTIAQTLGVNHLLEGSVRKSGNDVRVTAQLINAGDGSHIWSKTYDRKLDDIFAIQDDISMAVADALQVTLGVGELARQQGMTHNVAAYDEYLAAQSSADITSGGLQSAIAHFERAVSIDPDFAMAWLALSSAYNGAANVIPSEVQGATLKGNQAFERARQLMPDAPEVLGQEATNSLNRGDWEEADRLLNAASAGSSSNSADSVRGFFLYLTGRAKEALGILERKRSIDPLDAGLSYRLAQTYAALGNTAAALTETERGLNIANAPTLNMTSLGFLIALAANDRKNIDKWLALMPVSDDANDLNVVLVKMLDDPTAALEELHRRAAEPASQTVIGQYVVSQWASYFGDQEFALKVFRGVSEDNPFLGQWAVWRPIYRNMRKLPGFKDYLRKIGLVDYWRKSGDWGDFCHPMSSANGGDDFECE
jgi:TolB-like protein/Tfp pilus assembly protein PilF